MLPSPAQNTLASKKTIFFIKAADSAFGRLRNNQDYQQAATPLTQSDDDKKRIHDQKTHFGYSWTTKYNGVNSITNLWIAVIDHMRSSLYWNKTEMYCSKHVSKAILQQKPYQLLTRNKLRTFWSLLNQDIKTAYGINIKNSNFKLMDRLSSKNQSDEKSLLLRNKKKALNNRIWRSA